MKSGIITTLSGLAVIMTTLASAQVPAVPRFINFQGFLTNPGGQPLNANVQLTFRMFDNPDGTGTALWTEVHPNVEVEDGLFNVVLGEITPLEPFPPPVPADFDYSPGGARNRWLEVQVNVAQPLRPLQAVVSVPYAFRASDALTLGGMLVADRTDDNVQAERNLDMNGNEVINADRIQVLSDRADGRVLTSDADGFGTWRAPTAGAETDPQVDDDMADNSVPRWDDDGDELVTGTIFDRSGNVGVGTDSPGAKLELIGGDFKLGSDISGSGSVLRFGSTASPVENPNNPIIFNKSGLGLTMRAWAYSLGINNANPSTLIPLTITHAGNVGMGTTTPEPGKRLDVNGQAIVRGHLTVSGGDIWLDANSTIRSPWGRLNIQSGAGESLSLNSAGGNVSIGTPSPAAKLDVNGDALIRGPLTLTADETLAARGTASPGTQYSSYDLLLNSSSWSTYYNSPVNRQWKIRSIGQNTYWGEPRLSFLSDYDNAERMVINMANGNVGVGTPSPAYKLDVNGEARVHALTLSAGDYRIQTPPDNHFPWYRTQFLALRANDDMSVLVPGLNGFRVTDYGGYVNNLILRDKPDINNNNFQLFLPYGRFAEGSDSRQKLNQEPLDYGLPEVMELVSRRYVRAASTDTSKTMEQDGEEEERGSEIGFIAQEVYEVVPEAVAKIEDHGKEIWLLSYSSLMPVLVNAIQEQQAMIEEQKKINAAQEKKIKSLEERIAALERK